MGQSATNSVHLGSPLSWIKFAQVLSSQIGIRAKFSGLSLVRSIEEEDDSRWRLTSSMFDGSGDFSIWKKRMYATLSVPGLKDVLSETSQDSKTMESKEEDPEKRRKKDADDVARSEGDEKAMNLIFMSVSDQVLRKIDKCTTTVFIFT